MDSEDDDFDYVKKEEPTVVPITAGVSMRSVAIGLEHVLALTDEGRVFMWGGASQLAGVPVIPTLFEEISEIKVRRVAAGVWHSAAPTDEGMNSSTRGCMTNTPLQSWEDMRYPPKAPCVVRAVWRTSPASASSRWRQSCGAHPWRLIRVREGIPP